MGSKSIQAAAYNGACTVDGYGIVYDKRTMHLGGDVQQLRGQKFAIF
jgi:hypothetical protein